MAAGFKKATVTSGDVAATLTNYPTYVDLSRLGITTLAEAESVRVYADSGKTTEWAREIVSVTEMHVKVPSLTSTVEIFVDWDGVRADYAVGATYGRNAVWADYFGVYHLEEGSGTVLTDSTGNTNGTLTGTTNWSTSSPKLGSNFLDFNLSSQYATLGVLGTYPDITITAWIKFGADTGVKRHWGLLEGGRRLFLTSWFSSGIAIRGAEIRSGSNTLPTITGTPDTNWHYITQISERGVTHRLYDNGVPAGSVVAVPDIDQTFPTIPFPIGVQTNNGSPNLLTDASINRFRLKKAVDSEDWTTTEYNNQNAESTFWGTWTDAGGGGGGGAAQAARRGAVMMG